MFNMRRSTSFSSGHLSVSDMEPSEPVAAGVQFIPKKMTTPLAREVAELFLILTDLQACKKGFDLLGTIPEDEQDDVRKFARSSIFRDAIVTFISCFDKDSPIHLDSHSVYQPLPDGRSEFFSYLEGLRHSWIAHRDGPHRQCSYIFHLDPNTAEVKVRGPMTSVFLHPKLTDIKQFADFVQIAIEYTKNLVDKKEAELVREFEALYPTQKLRLKPPGFRIAGPEHQRMGRRKYENISPTLPTSAQEDN